MSFNFSISNNGFYSQDNFKSRKSLDEEQMAAVIKSMTVVTCASGEAIAVH